MSKKKAPDAGQGVEGQNPEGNNMSDSKVARERRAAKARPGTIAANHTVAITDTPSDAWLSPDAAPIEFVDVAEKFDSETLATMPMRIRATKERAEVWRAHDGSWYRHAGFVRIQPCDDGVRRFVVLIPQGANRDDVEHLLRSVRRARNGELGHRWAQVTSDWADELTFSLRFTSRPYRDPHMFTDHSQPAFVCDEPLCRDSWHDGYGTHEADSVTRKLPEDRGRYSISVTRMPEGGEPWKVDVMADDFFGTPEDVAAFVSDLQWMSETCRRANEGAVAASDRQVA
ncbi:hypothetical protein [Microbacterium arborescens]|uniref:hypothetical protein n=1 Tax=Microbacterium arborescens TaxID=33883 RepID=UPI0027869CA8|nr:hypothetical protein [Microbacterium arborescens]MDQ1217980.1 hypothetical protein [Microbacterium arborescens]